MLSYTSALCQAATPAFSFTCTLLHGAACCHDFLANCSDANMCSSPEEGLQLRESEGIKCKVLAHLTEAARCSCSGSSTPSSSMKALSAAVAASSGSSATSGAGPGESHTPMTAAISRECAAVRLETCLQYWHVSVSNAMVQDEDSSCGRQGISAATTTVRGLMRPAL